MGDENKKGNATANVLIPSIPSQSQTVFVTTVIIAAHFTNAKTAIEERADLYEATKQRAQEDSRHQAPVYFSVLLSDSNKIYVEK